MDKEITMDKSITMIINDTKKGLADVCSESKLPACILELLIKDLYNDLHAISNQQLKQELTIYNNSISENI